MPVRLSVTHRQARSAHYPLPTPSVSPHALPLLHQARGPPTLRLSTHGPGPPLPPKLNATRLSLRAFLFEAEVDQWRSERTGVPDEGKDGEKAAQGTAIGIKESGNVFIRGRLNA
jgi:hypothetical protein